MAGTQAGDLFKLECPYQDPLRGGLFNVVKKPLSKLLCLPTLNKMYATASTLRQQPLLTGDFLANALDVMGVTYDLESEARSRIPAKGPAVVVANHPFGAVEGLMIAQILRSVRPDVKVMANFMLGRIPEMREHLLFVDPFGTAESFGKNIGGLKKCIRWVKDGGMLAVFPAGEVASVKLTKRLVADPAWSPTVARIVKIAKAPVVPMFFGGRNGALFQILGLIHPRLRTVMLPRENLNKRANTIQVSVGDLIENNKLAGFKSDQEVISYLRFRTYLLRPRTEARTIEPLPVPAGHLRSVAQAKPVEDLAAEVDRLPDEKVLVRTPEFLVLDVTSKGNPCIMHEIGRLREKTFRAADEGSGKPLDLDRFDRSYHHLVLWNHKEREIAGAYRVGATDEILGRGLNLRKLYTSTLFTYKPDLFRIISPALELGRAFIPSKYQKSYAPLTLLWKGIGKMVLRDYKYRFLIGPVSLSAGYHNLSREMIMGFLARHHGHKGLASLVKAKHPPKPLLAKGVDLDLPETAFADPADMGRLVSEAEPGKSTPILLKHYLKLDGRAVAFNLDPKFGNCIDALLVVDLLRTSPRIMARFMGKEETEAFLDHHRHAAKDMDPRLARIYGE